MAFWFRPKGKNPFRSQSYTTIVRALLSRYFPPRDADDPSSPSPPPPPFHSVIYRHSDVDHPTLNSKSAPCKSHELHLKNLEKSKWRRNSNAKLADHDNASFTDETGSVIPTPLSPHHARSKRQVGFPFIPCCQTEQVSCEKVICRDERSTG